MNGEELWSKWWSEPPFLMAWKFRHVDLVSFRSWYESVGTVGRNEFKPKLTSGRREFKEETWILRDEGDEKMFGMNLSSSPQYNYFSTEINYTLNSTVGSLITEGHLSQKFLEREWKGWRWRFDIVKNAILFDECFTLKHWWLVSEGIYYVILARP